MWRGKVDVDGNGIVLFDPVVIDAWRPDMKDGTDLFEGVVVADLAVLRHWLRDVGWTRVAVPAGNYGVTVRGLRRMSADQKSLEAMGYEYVLRPEPALPRVTAETARNMRVMNWWPERKAPRRP